MLPQDAHQLDSESSVSLHTLPDTASVVRHDLLDNDFDRFMSVEPANTPPHSAVIQQLQDLPNIVIVVLHAMLSQCDSVSVMCVEAGRSIVPEAVARIRAADPTAQHRRQRLHILRSVSILRTSLHKQVRGVHHSSHVDIWLA